MVTKTKYEPVANPAVGLPQLQIRLLDVLGYATRAQLIAICREFHEDFGSAKVQYRLLASRLAKESSNEYSLTPEGKLMVGKEPFPISTQKHGVITIGSYNDEFIRRVRSAARLAGWRPAE